MSQAKFAVVGVGATGAVLAAALLAEHPETILVVRSEETRRALLADGIKVHGEINLQAPVTSVVASPADLAQAAPEIVLIATKTFHLDPVLDDLAWAQGTGAVLVSTHNGLGPEDVIAERFGEGAAQRMSLNYGVALEGPGRVHAAFFNRPNPLGCLDPASRPAAEALAGALTAAGLDTEVVEDIKLLVWKKMIMKCTMASICAVTDRTIKGCLEYPPTRQIADGCFAEVLAVAKARGYDLGPDYMTQAMAFLEKVGIHKDSMCVDIANRTRTEIDFLGGKVVEYAEAAGIDAPYYRTMTNLVRALEDSNLKAAR